MNTNLWALLFGIVGGVAGGMGMGGGTLLVPLLSMLDIEQKIIQAINLLSFLPMSIIAVIIHKKHGLIQGKVLLPCIIPTMIAGTMGALLASSARNNVLRFCFAVYLLAVGVWQTVLSVIAYKKAHLRKQRAMRVIACPTYTQLKAKKRIRRLAV